MENGDIALTLFVPRESHSTVNVCEPNMCKDDMIKSAFIGNFVEPVGCNETHANTHVSHSEHPDSDKGLDVLKIYDTPPQENPEMDARQQELSIIDELLAMDLSKPRYENNSNNMDIELGISIQASHSDGLSEPTFSPKIVEVYEPNHEICLDSCDLSEPLDMTCERLGGNDETSNSEGIFFPEPKPFLMEGISADTCSRQNDVYESDSASFMLGKKIKTEVEFVNVKETNQNDRMMPILISLDDEEHSSISNLETDPEVIHIPDSPEMPILVPFTSDNEVPIRIKCEQLSDPEDICESTSPQIHPLDHRGNGTLEPRVILKRITLDNCSHKHGPVIDVIDGINFFSFGSRVEMEQYITTHGNDFIQRSHLGLEEQDEADLNMIIPRKTTDITQIKGWRNKYFAPEACIQPLNTDLVSGTVKDDAEVSNHMEESYREDSSLNATSNEKTEQLVSLERNNSASPKTDETKPTDLQSQGDSKILPNGNASTLIENVSGSGDCNEENHEDKKLCQSPSHHNLPAECKDSKDSKHLHSPGSEASQELKNEKSVFTSDELDIYLKESAELSISYLEEKHPNIISIPSDSLILSLGNLKKEAVPGRPLPRSKSVPIPKENNEIKVKENEHKNEVRADYSSTEEEDESGSDDSEDDVPVAQLIKAKRQEVNKTPVKPSKKRKTSRTRSTESNSQGLVLRFKRSNDQGDAYRIASVSHDSTEESEASSSSSSQSEEDSEEEEDVTSVSVIKRTLFSGKYESAVLNEFINNLNMCATRKDVAMLVQLNQSHFDECQHLGRSGALHALSALRTREELAILKQKRKVMEEIRLRKKTKLEAKAAKKKKLAGKLGAKGVHGGKKKTPEISNHSMLLAAMNDQRGKRSIRLPARYLDSAVLAAGSEWVSPVVSPEEVATKRMKRQSPERPERAKVLDPKHNEAIIADVLSTSHPQPSIKWNTDAKKHSPNLPSKVSSSAPAVISDSSDSESSNHSSSSPLESDIPLPLPVTNCECLPCTRTAYYNKSLKKFSCMCEVKKEEETSNSVPEIVVSDSSNTCNASQDNILSQEESNIPPKESETSLKKDASPVKEDVVEPSVTSQSPKLDQQIPVISEAHSVPVQQSVPSSTVLLPIAPKRYSMLLVQPPKVTQPAVMLPKTNTMASFIAKGKTLLQKVLAEKLELVPSKGLLQNAPNVSAAVVVPEEPRPPSGLEKMRDNFQAQIASYGSINPLLPATQQLKFIANERAMPFVQKNLIKPSVSNPTAIFNGATPRILSTLLMVQPRKIPATSSVPANQEKLTKKVLITNHAPRQEPQPSRQEGLESLGHHNYYRKKERKRRKPVLVERRLSLETDDEIIDVETPDNSFGLRELLMQNDSDSLDDFGMGRDRGAKMLKEKERRTLLRHSFLCLKGTSSAFKGIASERETLQVASFIINCEVKREKMFIMAKKRLRIHNIALLKKLKSLLTTLPMAAERKQVKRRVIDSLGLHYIYLKKASYRGNIQGQSPVITHPNSAEANTPRIVCAQSIKTPAESQAQVQIKPDPVPTEKNPPKKEKQPECIDISSSDSSDSEEEQSSRDSPEVTIGMGLSGIAPASKDAPPGTTLATPAFTPEKMGGVVPPPMSHLSPPSSGLKRIEPETTQSRNGTAGYCLPSNSHAHQEMVNGEHLSAANDAEGIEPSSVQENGLDGGSPELHLPKDFAGSEVGPTGKPPPVEIIIDDSDDESPPPANVQEHLHSAALTIGR